jgi:hypothetical protein
VGKSLPEILQVVDRSIRTINTRGAAKDSHSIMARWRNYFSQILIVHGVGDVRQAEIHTAEPLVP